MGVSVEIYHKKLIHLDLVKKYLFENGHNVYMLNFCQKDKIDNSSMHTSSPKKKSY